MDEYIKEISEKIEDKKEYYAKISDKIWEYAEPRFQEYKSSELLQQTLKKEGFSIKSNLAGEETAFIAEYGSGKPVIGFLGEFDALPGLSQKADTTERIGRKKHQIQNMKACRKEKKKQNPDSGHTDNCGHGCGHQLIGTGTLFASVIALKDFMKEHNLKGTIRYYGCPAEEKTQAAKRFSYATAISMTVTSPSAGTRNRDDAHATEAPKQTSESSSHSTEPRHTPPCARN